MAFTTILNRSFPGMQDQRHRWLGAILFGLFVFLFLQLFKPFGLAEVKGELWLVNVSYGIVTFVAILIMQFRAVALFPGFYREERWTLGKEILHTTLIVLLVAAGNFLYSAWLGFFPFGFGVFVKFLGFTLAVGVFPVSIQALIRQNRLQRKYAGESRQISANIDRKELQETKERIELEDEEGRVQLSLEPSKLLAMESADNYVIVYFVHEDTVDKALIRNSLKYFEETFGGRLPLFRCHRSWLVHIGQALEVSGNARGYSLELHPKLKGVPVARRKAAEFREKLRVYNGTGANP